MTLSVIIITIVYGTVSSVIATYIVRFIDKKHKNNRPRPKDAVIRA